MFLSLKSKLLLAEICRNISLEKIKGTWKGVASWLMPMPWVVVDSKPVSEFDDNSSHSRIFALWKISTHKYLRSRKFSLEKICTQENYTKSVSDFDAHNLHLIRTQLTFLDARASLALPPLPPPPDNFRLSLRQPLQPPECEGLILAVVS